MDNKNKKCSLVEHNENDAICFCQECKIYMCNKCENCIQLYLRIIIHLN